MSEEKDKEKEKKPDTTGQTAEKPVETPVTTRAEIVVKHEFLKGEKPADVPPAETPKPAEPPKVETPTETPAEKELRETKEKLEERDSQLALISLAEFNSQKTTFLSQIKDETKRASAEKMIGDDPDKLESAKMMAQLISSAIEQSGSHITGKPETPTETPKTPTEKPEEIDDGTEKKPPKGANIPPAPATPAGGDAKAIAIEAINVLFTTLSDPSKSEEEKRLANEKINEMYASFRAGHKEGEHGARDKDFYPLPPTMSCPKCGQVMFGIKCVCGYEVPKEQRKLELR